MKLKHSGSRILVIRNDKIGDFCLAWPLFSLLRYYLPDSFISALVPDYTLQLAQLHPDIDECILDRSEENISNIIRDKRFDNLLTLYSTRRIAFATRRAGIPYRLAPATRWWQWFYNHRLAQRRSQSIKPEYAYNLDLGYRMLHDLGVINEQLYTCDKGDNDYLPSELARPLLRLQPTEVHSLRENFLRTNGINENAMLIFVHPGSGGSANNLSIDQYVNLLNSITEYTQRSLSIVISAGPEERSQAEKLRDGLSAEKSVLLNQSDGLRGLTHHIAFADLFISNSTGPLHLAGLLDRPTAGFYPRHRSGNPLRWQTLNAPEKRLVFSPPDAADPQDVSAVDAAMAAGVIAEYLNRQVDAAEA